MDNTKTSSATLTSILIVMIAAMAVYSIAATMNEGINLFAVFSDNLTSLGWSGQFNLDFMCYLILSGLWIMWRDRFSSSSIILGGAAMILGILLFAPILIYLIKKEKGDLRAVLLGRND
jgi:hydrogenase-4 membrane subunit HyfE